MEVVVGNKYKHFKGHIYEVIAVARHCEDLSYQVVYRNVDDKESIWVRSLEEFTSKVDKEKYPNVTQEDRFELIND